MNGFFATGWALVDGIAIGNRFGIGSATRIPTLATLGLRQQRIDLLADGIAFNAKPDGGKAEQCAKNGAQSQQCSECCQERLLAE